MCLLLFIAADHPLPLISWHETHPDFHVAALSEPYKVVRQQFSRNHVRYVGTAEKCGCPFNYGREYPEYETEATDLAIALRSRQMLVQYLMKNWVQEIYSCEAGEEAKPPKVFREINPKDILQNNFIFERQELISIR